MDELILHGSLVYVFPRLHGLTAWRPIPSRSRMSSQQRALGATPPGGPDTQRGAASPETAPHKRLFDCGLVHVAVSDFRRYPARGRHHSPCGPTARDLSERALEGSVSSIAPVFPARAAPQTSTRVGSRNRLETQSTRGDRACYNRRYDGLSGFRITESPVPLRFCVFAFLSRFGVLAPKTSERPNA
jgi:hypothetical protein